MYLQLTVYFILAFVLALSAYTIILNKKNISKISKDGSSVLEIIFIGYLSAIIALTIIPSERFSLDQSIRLTNYVPVINTYKRYAMVTYFDNYPGIKNFWQNFIGNIILFIPLGFFLSFSYNKRFLAVAAIAFLGSSLIEIIQYIFSFWGYYRYIDIDDVLLNTAGAAFGFFVCQMTLKYYPSILRSKNNRVPARENIKC